jgi:hypothetical protein
MEWHEVFSSDMVFASTPSMNIQNPIALTTSNWKFGVN